VRLALDDPDVGMVLVHSLVDAGTDRNDPDQGFGVVRADLSPKPAFAQLAAITAFPRIAALSMNRRRFRARARRRPRLKLVVSKPVTLAVTVERVVRRRRARRRARLVQRFSRSLGQGAQQVSLKSRRPLRTRRLGAGAYTVTVRATDRYGRDSNVRRARFRVVR
jgi:hypothetical protein